MPELINIADILPLRAEQHGQQIAIRCPGSKASNGFARYDQTLSYAELDTRSNAIARGLQAFGIGQGKRAVVMLKPSLDFFFGDVRFAEEWRGTGIDRSRHRALCFEAMLGRS